MYSGTILTSKKYIVLLHTLSAHNSLLVHYKFYSTDPRECLCTSWRYVEAYENFSIDPAPCRKNYIKKIKLSAPTTRRKLQMFWKKTSFQREDLNQPFDDKSWYKKRIKLNLILTNPEQEISILKKQFLIMPGFPKSNCKIKIRIFSSFILIFNLRKLKKSK